MPGAPLSNLRGRDPLGDPSMANRLAFVCSTEFTGWACNKCDWRFPVNPSLVFTDAGAEEVVTAFDEHRCGDRATFDGRVCATVQRGEVSMNKTSAIAEWLLPLLLWVAVAGIFVSLVIAALSSATG